MRRLRRLTTTPLRFATFLAPNMAPVYRFLADRIGQRRFAPVGDGVYDDIRSMLASIEAAGWTSLTQPAPSP